MPKKKGIPPAINFEINPPRIEKEKLIPSLIVRFREYFKVNFHFFLYL